MFQCQVCFINVPANTPCNRKVTFTRVKRYPERPYAKREKRLDKKGKKKWVWIPDPGGVGREIVGEINCCPSCAAKID